MRKLTCLILLLCASSLTKAQTYEKYKIGLHATPTFRWLSVDSKGVKNDGVNMGFNYGLAAEIFFTERYSFFTGVDFAYRGGKLVYDVQDTAGNVTKIKSNVSLQYLEVPLCLHLHTKEQDNLSFYAKFGTSACFNLKAKAEVDGESNNINKDVNFFNMALKIGGGAQYNIQSGTCIFGGITFNNGFIDVFKSDDLKANVAAIEIDLGVYF
ncbi:MAG: PorT family protein [Bacteroidia bacterium]|nr:PorT family protein [Bacteroidia bacterium]